MYYRLDEYYRKIMKKIEDGTFKNGNVCKLTRYYFEGKTISDFPLKERTPEVCSSLIDYGNCRFSDVPRTSRTRKFFIASFTDSDVFDYIKGNIDDFDRKFFKDLIVSNQYATAFDRNCFAIMPLEYIDEEMCSLAIINSLNFNDDKWFYSVYSRKPEALTDDLWKLGARLYANFYCNENNFLSITPEQYKDIEYYKEMCSCSFNCGMVVNKDKIMDSLPQEVLTIDFLLDLLNLLNSNINNISSFNEKALETKIVDADKEKLINIIVDNMASYKWSHLMKINSGSQLSSDEIKTKMGEVISDIIGCEKLWQFIIRIDGHMIRYMPLNDERVEFFLRYYDEFSGEYKISFRDKYRRYKNNKMNEVSTDLTYDSDKKVLVKEDGKKRKK